ncbi:MFS transporter [Rathayibacter sp. YIM 133350]|uniref:MFS transporter n=1 Tax=Rathayibacter sp. YIM 133350 TaxID=3131992 RepID=UPI00307E55D5
MNSRRSWFVFGVGAFLYLTAVLQRSSLGVAGVAAADRFDVAAATLSTLAVVQIAVYAAMQIPVGVLIDRFGPRVLMLTGTAIMIAGQVAVGFADTIGLAVLGRILVGLGDATVFVSLIRLVSSWFSGRLVPQLSQWSGNVGALGQVLSALPFAFILRSAGWTPAFLSAASLGLLALLLGAAVIRDRPAGDPDTHRVSHLGEAVHQLREAFRRPGTQLGFWSHFVSQSPGTVFSLFWGYPFLVFGLGYEQQLAADLLLLLVGAGLVAGPVLGLLSARFPFRRSSLVLAIVVAMGLMWVLVLAWPGAPPLWLVALLIVVMGVGGPGSLIGFDFARTFNPQRSLGAANGVVNVGGFLASFIMIFLIGVLLDLQDQVRIAAGVASALYSLASFRIAFLVEFVVVGAGVLFLLHARRRTRRKLYADEGIQVAPIWVALVRAWRRRATRAR